MLESQVSLPETSRRLVDKIARSSERMSLLITDLLEFSRLLKSEALVRPVNLQEVVAAVVSDFELLVTEKGATITVGHLPVIQAIGLQMNQLFYNLVSNALKFNKPDMAPLVAIHAETIGAGEAARHIAKPLPFATYHHITISDNGIGFDVKYAEQIFEVFKRLHGREMYPGSGIGLALCRRIVDNHNGSLYAVSAPNEGTIFHLILPDRQQDHDPTLPARLDWAND
jgi:signal transduction histidine kinase